MVHLLFLDVWEPAYLINLHSNLSRQLLLHKNNDMR